eukprot:1264258-Prorocentrum_lima.AAC.1
MTSSLVGSEMCIRDSPLVAPIKLKSDAPKEVLKVIDMLPTLGAPRGTVSYTHLTLPTICSV